jgi:hypothetical protein
MKFAIFFMGEYMNMMTISAVVRDAVPRRLARPVPRSRSCPHGWPGDLDRHQGHALDVLLPVGALDVPAPALRPAHGVRLEVLLPLSLSTSS